MRALAVQQRTVWHPGTPSPNSTMVPVSDPRIPAGLPSHIQQVRIRTGRDSYPNDRTRVPTAVGTQIIWSAWVCHDPFCPAGEHGDFRGIYTYNNPSKWVAAATVSLDTVDWVLMRQTLSALGGPLTPYYGTTTFDSLCTWFMADDWITLTP